MCDIKKALKLYYVSDLHLEFETAHDLTRVKSIYERKKDDDTLNYLVLAGDIGSPMNNSLEEFLSKCSSVYDKVIYVPGNHEYYDRSHSYMETKRALTDLCNLFENVILLDDEYMDEECIGIRFIGSTLWSNVSKRSSRMLGCTYVMNDYEYIYSAPGKKITVTETNILNHRARKFISESIYSSSYPCVIITHFSPLFSDPDSGIYTSDPKYLHSPTADFFHNDLRELIRTPVVLWIFGHTHHSTKFKYKDCIVTANQLGYRMKDEEGETIFNPDTFILFT